MLNINGFPLITFRSTHDTKKDETRGSGTGSKIGAVYSMFQKERKNHKFPFNIDFAL